MALAEGLVHGRCHLLICQHLIGVPHPVFAQIAHLFGDQPVAEAALCTPHLNHVACAGLRRRGIRAQQFMIEFANALDRLLQLLIIGEQAANLGDPLASHAELPCASTAIADCQNEDPVPFTARTFWAALGVADGALQQRATQQLTSDRQLAQELLACSKGSRSNYLHESINGGRHSQLKSVRACSFPQKLRFKPQA